MVQAINSFQAVAQTAWATAKASTAADVAQRILESISELFARLQTQTEFTSDGLVNVPDLTSAQFTALATLEECRILQPSSKNPLGPYKIPQLDASALLQIADPTGDTISLAELEQLPIYPAVQERLMWSKRCSMLNYGEVDCSFFENHSDIEDALYDFLDLKGSIVEDRMSEAECVQYAMLSRGHWKRPQISTSLPTKLTDAAGREWTLIELGQQPPSVRVRMLQHTVAEYYRLDNLSIPIHSDANWWVEADAHFSVMMRQAELRKEARGQIMLLSDAELYQWVRTPEYHLGD